MASPSSNGPASIDSPRSFTVADGDGAILGFGQRAARATTEDQLRRTEARDDLRLQIRQHLVTEYFDLIYGSGAVDRRYQRFEPRWPPPPDVQSSFQPVKDVSEKKLLGHFEELSEPYLHWYTQKVAGADTTDAQKEAKDLAQLILKDQKDREIARAKIRSGTFLYPNTIDAASELEVQCLLNRAHLAYKQKKFQKVSDLGYEALQSAQTLNYEPIVARCWYWIGLAKRELGKRLLAAEDILKALPCVGKYVEGTRMPEAVNSLKDEMVSILLRTKYVPEESYRYWSDWLDSQAHLDPAEEIEATGGSARDDTVVSMDPRDTARRNLSRLNTNQDIKEETPKKIEASRQRPTVRKGNTRIPKPISTKLPSPPPTPTEHRPSYTGSKGSRRRGDTPGSGSFGEHIFSESKDNAKSVAEGPHLVTPPGTNSSSNASTHGEIIERPKSVHSRNSEGSTSPGTKRSDTSIAKFSAIERPLNLKAEELPESEPYQDCKAKLAKRRKWKSTLRSKEKGIPFAEAEAIILQEDSLRLQMKFGKAAALPSTSVIETSAIERSTSQRTAEHPQVHEQPAKTQPIIDAAPRRVDALHKKRGMIRQRQTEYSRTIGVNVGSGDGVGPSQEDRLRLISDRPRIAQSQMDRFIQRFRANTTPSKFDNSTTHITPGDPKYTPAGDTIVGDNKSVRSHNSSNLANSSIARVQSCDSRVDSQAGPTSPDGKSLSPDQSREVHSPLSGLESLTNSQVSPVRDEPGGPKSESTDSNKTAKGEGKSPVTNLDDEGIVPFPLLEQNEGLEEQRGRNSYRSPTKHAVPGASSPDLSREPSSSKSTSSLPVRWSSSDSKSSFSEINIRKFLKIQDFLRSSFSRLIPHDEPGKLTSQSHPDLPSQPPGPPSQSPDLQSESSARSVHNNANKQDTLSGPFSASSPSLQTNHNPSSSREYPPPPPPSPFPPPKAPQSPPEIVSSGSVSAPETSSPSRQRTNRILSPFSSSGHRRKSVQPASTPRRRSVAPRPSTPGPTKPTVFPKEEEEKLNYDEDDVDPASEQEDAATISDSDSDSDTNTSITTATHTSPLSSQQTTPESAVSSTFKYRSTLTPTRSPRPASLKPDLSSPTTLHPTPSHNSQTLPQQEQHRDSPHTPPSRRHRQPLHPPPTRTRSNSSASPSPSRHRRRDPDHDQIVASHVRELIEADPELISASEEERAALKRVIGAVYGRTGGGEEEDGDGDMYSAD